MAGPNRFGTNYDRFSVPFRQFLYIMLKGFSKLEGCFFLALQSHTWWLQQIVFLEVLTEITGSLGNRPFGPKNEFQ